jgi:hypothetical protein
LGYVVSEVALSSPLNYQFNTHLVGNWQESKSPRRQFYRFVPIYFFKERSRSSHMNILESLRKWKEQPLHILVLSEEISGR